MVERWRSAAARDLASMVRQAGGQIERAGMGKIRITGPAGAVTIYEPEIAPRLAPRRNSVRAKVEQRTGLVLGRDG